MYLVQFILHDTIMKLFRKYEYTEYEHTYTYIRKFIKYSIV